MTVHEINMICTSSIRISMKIVHNLSIKNENEFSILCLLFPQIIFFLYNLRRTVQMFTQINMNCERHRWKNMDDFTVCVWGTNVCIDCISWVITPHSPAISTFFWLIESRTIRTTQRCVHCIKFKLYLFI